MKTLTIIVLLTLSTQTFASFSLSNSLAYTIAEVIYSVAIPVASTGASTAMSQENRKEAAQLKIDIQEFYQSGVMSLSLQNKIELVKEIDSSLSLNESLDALVSAADLALN
jgi:hypothetical protein